MDFTFEQNEQRNEDPLTILGEERERVTHFKYLRTTIEEEYMWYRKAGGSRLETSEEMQWCTVRQKDARDTEGEGLQNSDQASNPRWGRNVGYNEETRKTD